MFTAHSACPTSGLPTPTPGTYFVQPLSTPNACAFHQQVQALAPQATASTFGGTASRLFASLTTEAGELLAYADGADAAEVLADLQQQLPDATETRLLTDRTA